eukprot:1727944-Pyramimonas_sp.AAC.1
MPETRGERVLKNCRNLELLEEGEQSYDSSSDVAACPDFARVCRTERFPGQAPGPAMGTDLRRPVTGHREGLA